MHGAVYSSSLVLLVFLFGAFRLQVLALVSYILVVKQYMNTQMVKHYLINQDDYESLLLFTL